jgi:hypothetical protein
MFDEPKAPTESELAARSEANAASTADAIRLAEEHKARDAAQGHLTGDAAIVNDVVPLLKDKLFGEQFGDPSTLRPREGGESAA